jgi:hypothetical protein
MVHAVCFNKKYMTGEKYTRVIEEIGANDGGTLIGSMDIFNCLESFPSGDIYRSLIWKENLDTEIIDCGEDIEKFIYVNKYGINKKEDMEYEDLIQLHQEGKIGTLEFVERQEDLTDMWLEWLKENNREKNELSANEFMQYIDEYMMSHQEQPV